jgi:hypothetical protein
MSVVAIRLALQTALNQMTPALATVWGNKAHTPAQGVPFQRVAVVFAQPDNAEISASYVQEGFLQATLCYPENQGPDLAEARADLIRTTFYRGRSLPPKSGIVTTISLTPEIMAGFHDGDRYCVPVRAPFFAPVQI